MFDSGGTPQGETDARALRARSLCDRIMAFAGDGDEVAVVDGFVARLELGRASYGPLDLAVDRRNWQREADEEIADWAVYRAIARTKAGLRELRDAIPTVTEAVSVFVGEGG